MKKTNIQNGNSKHFSSLRGAIATKQSRLLRFARNDGETGNALWFILIAIILLGLLTSMLIRSGSSTNDTGNYEQLTIQANEILNYAKSIENGVQSLLARGCSENDISFEANNNSGYVNPNAPADKSCHLFAPEGAGLIYTNPNAKWLDTAQSAKDLYGEIYFPSSSCVKNVGAIAPACNGNGLPDEELLFILPYLKQGLCLAINKINGFNAIPQDNVSMWSGTEPKFTGQLIEGAAIASPDSTYWGATTLCIEGDINPAAGTYHLYHVLLAR